MSDLRPKGIKTNHKKGIVASRQLQKRKDAELRNTSYQSLTLDQKLSRNSSKVQTKLKSK